jgi:transposase
MLQIGVYKMSRKPFFIRLDEPAKIEVVTFMQETAHRHAFRVRRRGNAVLLSHQGWTMNQIARQFRVSVRTVRTWLQHFRAKGIASLYDPARPRSLSPEQENRLFDISQRAKLIKARRPLKKRLPSLRYLARWTKQHYGITLSAMQISRIIRRKLHE